MYYTGVAFSRLWPYLSLNKNTGALPTTPSAPRGLVQMASDMPPILNDCHWRLQLHALFPQVPEEALKVADPRLCATITSFQALSTLIPHHCFCQGQNVAPMQLMSIVTMYSEGVTFPRVWPYLSLGTNALSCTTHGSRHERRCCSRCRYQCVPVLPTKSQQRVRCLDL
jgi:hypothetical protein